MFDEFRKPTEDQPQEQPLTLDSNEPIPVSQPSRSRGPLLGMTPVQRFILALMLFFMVCLLGGFCLIITERVVLPFF
jgi:hypothetical protein